MVVKRCFNKKDYVEHFRNLSGFESINKDEQIIYFKKIDDGSLAKLLVAS